MSAGKESLGYSEDEEVYAVLEEDGTEVDEEEYFQVVLNLHIILVINITFTILFNKIIASC